MNIKPNLTKTASLLWVALLLAALLMLPISPSTVMAQGDLNTTASMSDLLEGILSAGNGYTCALKPDGSVDCWGWNDEGESTDQPGPFTKIDAGHLHTCGLRPDSSVDCWGWNGSGEATSQSGPFTQISTGGWHTCGLKPDGSVDCWGDNSYEQATDQAGPFTQISAGFHYTCGLKPDGSIDCWGLNYDGEAADRPGPFTHLSASGYITCGLKPDGSADCWGVLGQTSAPGPFTQISAGFYHICGLKPDGSVDCWGENGSGAATDQPGPFAQISAGAVHTCGLKPDASVDCWGDNRGGEATDQPGPFGPYVPPYAFTGFYSPVDNLPTLNIVKAGQSIPVKFSLGGDEGLQIFAAGYPRAQQIACDTGAPGDAIEETLASGTSGLQYDPATDTYTYVWKTQKSWARTCRQLILRLADGTDHIANFQFK